MKTLKKKPALNLVTYKIPHMYVYVCATTYNYELGDCPDVVFYSSVEELRKKHRCTGTCGIVKLKIDLKPLKLLEAV